MKSLLFALLMVPSVFISGCTYAKPLMVSSASLGPKEIPKAIGSGTSVADYLFGFRFPSDNDSMEAAIKDFKARSKIKGISSDTMANVFVDREVSYFPAWWLPIFVEKKTTVFGTLIEYEGVAKEDYKVIHSSEPKTLKWYER